MVLPFFGVLCSEFIVGVSGGQDFVGQADAVGLEVPIGTGRQLDDLNGAHIGLQSGVDCSADAIGGVAIFQHHIQVGEETALVIRIGDVHEELVHDAGNVGVCQTVLHGQDVQIAAAIAGRGTAAHGKDMAAFVHVTHVAHVIPQLIILVDLQHSGGGFGVIVAHHQAGAADTDLTDLIVAQLLGGTGLEDGNGGQGHGAAYVAVAGGTTGNVERQRTGLAGTEGSGELDLGLVIQQELVDALELGVVAGFGTGTQRHDVRNIVVSGDAVGVHQNVHEHGDHGPVIGLVAHQLQIDIFRSHPGIQDQQLVGGKGQQEHGDDHGHQGGRQDGVQPGGTDIGGAVEIHLHQIAQHGISGMDHLLGRAGGTAGIAAVHRAHTVGGNLHGAFVVVAHVQEFAPAHGIVAAGALALVQVVQILHNVIGHILSGAVLTGIHQDAHAYVGGVHILVQRGLGHEAVGEHDLGTGIPNGLGVFVDFIVTAQEAGADLFRCQQQGNEFGHGLQQDGDLVASADAQSPQGLGDAVGQIKKLAPGDFGAVVVDRGHIQTGAVQVQVFTEGKMGGMQLLHQSRGVIFHPGFINTGFASQHRISQCTSTSISS